MRSTLLLVAFALTTGCAAFPDDRLPKRTTADITPRRGRVAVDYDVKGSFNGVDNPDFASDYAERIDAGARRSGAFTRFSKGRGEPLHLTFSFDDAQSDGGTAALCGLTMGLFPAIVSDNFVLNVRLDRGGNTIKSWRYEDGMTTFMEIFLLFVAPFKWMISVAHDTFDNMLLCFLYDFVNDPVLTDGPPPPPPSSEPAAPPPETKREDPAPVPNAPPPSDDR